MKMKIILISIAVFSYAFFSIPSARADVIISELSIGNYIGGKATSTDGDDFIELYNTGGTCIPLEGWRLRKRIQSGAESPLYSFKKGDAIMPSDFLLWVSSKAKSDYQKLADAMPTSSQEYALSGNNSVALLDNRNAVRDAVTLGSNHAQPFSPSALLLNPGDGRSIGRNLSSLKWNEADSVPTPTGSSSFADSDLDGDGCPDQAAPDTPGIPTSYSIRLNEILPDPSAKGDTGEFIELYSFGTEPTDISGWILRDATKTGKYVFPSGTSMPAGTYLAVTDQSFKLSLNNSNETVSLFDSEDTLVDSVHYEKTKGDVSLNYTPAGWRGGKPTPGAANILNNLPEVKEKVPKKGWRGVPVLFNAEGKDADKQELKYTWDFGDGHKSYKSETSHTYEKSGSYAVTLTTTDGVEDAVETYPLKITSYKAPEIRITSLVPNPSGKDTDNEWIMLENREKKSVNLKGFGIATGWKNLANHPIREDFILEPKSEAKLTRAYSLFALPNQKGKIELRAPDGKVLQKIRYKLEKSAADDAVYLKKKGRRWSFEETAIKREAAQPETESPEDEKAEEESALPTADEQQVPEKEKAAEQQPEENPAGTPKGPLSQDPEQPKPADLLSYGTSLRLPDDVTFIPSNSQMASGAAPSSEPSSASADENLLDTLNASLNGLLNDF